MDCFKLRNEAMRRGIMNLIALGIGFFGIQVISTVNAAELFNTVKKKEAPSGVPAQRSDGVTLFNKKQGLNALRTPGLSSTQKQGSAARDAQDVMSALVMQGAQMNAYMKQSGASAVGRTVKANDRWSYYSVGAQNANIERTKYALQLENGRRQYAAKYAAADRKMAEIFINKLRQDDVVVAQKIAQQNKSWDDMKKERRMALYGKQVDKSYGGNAFAPKNIDQPVSYGDTNRDTKSSTVVIKHNDKVVKKSSTPRLFNNIK